MPGADLMKAAYSDTLGYLDRKYKGARRYYQLDDLLKMWNEPGTVRDLFMEMYLPFVVLDHYYTRMPIDISLKMRKKNSRFWKYLTRRAHESVQIGVVARLKAIAVYRLLPESWYQEEQWKKEIRQSVQRAAAVGNPEITFDLKIAPSGKAWINSAVRTGWTRLKAHLDHQRPQIITYIVQTTDYAHRAATVIAYGYRHVAQDKVEVQIYDAVQNRDATLRIDLRRFGHYVNRTRIDGFYVEQYQPRSVPLEWWQFLLKQLFLLDLLRVIRRVALLLPGGRKGGKRHNRDTTFGP